MKGVRTFLGIATLMWSFVQAPFLHIHSEELEHAASSPVHFHFHYVGELKRI